MLPLPLQLQRHKEIKAWQVKIILHMLNQLFNISQNQAIKWNGDCTWRVYLLSRTAASLLKYWLEISWLNTLKHNNNIYLFHVSNSIKTSLNQLYQAVSRGFWFYSSGTGHPVSQSSVCFGGIGTLTVPRHLTSSLPSVQAFVLLFPSL